MIESFLQYIRYEKNYSSYTVLSYQEDLKQFEEYAKARFKKFEPDTFSPQQVRSWIIDMMDSGAKVSTVKRKLSALRSFYKYLNRKGVTVNNPTQKIQPIKGEKVLPKFFLEKDMDRCLDLSEINRTFGSIRDGLIVEMLYQTGLRRSELSSLKDKDVDINQKQLKVLGKGNKERMVPFGESLAGMIDEYIELREKEIGLHAQSFFVDRNGEPLNPGQIYYIVRKLMGNVSTQEKRSPHVVRHTFATTMLNNGADINAIKKILGHESLSTTQVYTHATFSEIQHNYQRAHPRAKNKGGYHDNHDSSD